jgi:hypothetical protein
VSGSRVDYPHWQRVFNVGFRVVAEARTEPATAQALLKTP